VSHLESGKAYRQSVTMYVMPCGDGAEGSPVPELPEMEGVRSFLERRLVGATVADVTVAAISAIKTADPPFEQLVGRVVSEVSRRGKFLLLIASGSPDLILAIHLSRAGWVKWHDSTPRSTPRFGRGPLAIRISFVSADGEMVGAMDLTEAGTRKRLSCHLVHEIEEVPAIARMGPEILRPPMDASEFALILRQAGGTHLKTLLRDQHAIAGIGNAYSDEILHGARLSPTVASKSLAAAAIGELHEAMVGVLTAAVESARATDDLTMLKDTKRSALKIHGHQGDPCPVCGEAILSVSSGEASYEYCATCQHGGRPLADRRMSRLLK
jgi:formamidopyrimidine-DNA glycosylase